MTRGTTFKKLLKQRQTALKNIPCNELNETGGSKLKICGHNRKKLFPEVSLLFLNR